MNATVLDKLLVPSALPNKSDQQPNKINPRLIQNQGVEPNRSFIKQFYAIFVEPLPNPNRIFQNRKERTATEPNNVGPILNTAKNDKGLGIIVSSITRNDKEL